MNTRWCNISTLNVFNLFLQIDGPSARFSARRRSEGIISRATGGVWVILVLVQNDPEKQNKKQKQNKKHQCPRAARASPKIAVP